MTLYVLREAVYRLRQEMYGSCYYILGGIVPNLFVDACDAPLSFFLTFTLILELGAIDRPRDCG